MDSDLNTQLATSRANSGPGSIQTAVLKKALDADANVATMMADAVDAAPPPPGQGLKVDKYA
jgi:hypothetical protein